MGEVEVDEEDVDMERQNVAILDWDTQYYRISISGGEELSGISIDILQWLI